MSRAGVAGRCTEQVAHDHRHRRIEDVAATGDSPNDCLRLIAKGAPNLEQTLREGIVRNSRIGPDCFDQLVLRDELSVV